MAVVLYVQWVGAVRVRWSFARSCAKAVNVSTVANIYARLSLSRHSDSASPSSAGCPNTGIGRLARPCPVVVRTSDLRIVGRRFQSRSWQVVHTHVPPSPSGIICYRSQAVMFYGWEGNRRQQWRRTDHASCVYPDKEHDNN